MTPEHIAALKSLLRDQEDFLACSFHRDTKAIYTPRIEALRIAIERETQHGDTPSKPLKREDAESA